MGSLFAQARAYAPLTPAQRALLKLVEGLALVGLVGGATALVQYLAAPTDLGTINAVDWPLLGKIVAAGAAVAMLSALSKYFKAHGDPALAAVLDQAAAVVTRDAAVPVGVPAGAGAGAQLPAATLGAPTEASGMAAAEPASGA